MFPPRCILALVSLDKTGEQVAQYAIQMAKGDNLVLATIVHVNSGCEFDPYPLTSSWDYFQQMVAEASQHLQAMSRHLGVQVPIRVEIGQGRTTALSLAKNVGADLVVVGEQASFNLNQSPFWFHLLTGTSVSVKVLVVPDQTERGPGRWLQHCQRWWNRHIQNGILAFLTRA